MSKQKLKIFVISLKHRQDRKVHIKARLDALGMSFEFFDAITPLNLPREIECKISDTFRKIFRSRPLSPGEKGCYASHYLLWKKCIKLNEPIIVLEDDCTILDGFKQFTLSFCHKVNYLCLEAHPIIGGVISVNGNEYAYHNVGSGARGYLITPDSAKKFISKSIRIDRAVDNFIGDAYRHGVPSLGLIDPVILDQGDKFETDIQNTQGKTKVFFLFKITREAYRFYRFFRNKLFVMRYKFKH